MNWKCRFVSIDQHSGIRCRYRLLDIYTNAIVEATRNGQNAYTRAWIKKSRFPVDISVIFRIEIKTEEVQSL